MVNCHMRAPRYQTGTQLLLRHHLPLYCSRCWCRRGHHPPFRIATHVNTKCLLGSNWSQTIFKPSSKEMNALESINNQLEILLCARRAPKIRQRTLGRAVERMSEYVHDVIIPQMIKDKSLVTPVEKERYEREGRDLLRKCFQGEHENESCCTTQCINGTHPPTMERGHLSEQMPQHHCHSKSHQPKSKIWLKTSRLTIVQWTLTAPSSMLSSSNARGAVVVDTIRCFVCVLLVLCAA